MEDIQKRLAAIETGSPAIQVSQGDAQGNVQKSSVDQFSSPASATLPYPGLDGHPRRITPIPISVNTPIPAMNVKSSDQFIQETNELIQRHEKGKNSRKGYHRNWGKKVSIKWVIS